MKTEIIFNNHYKKGGISFPFSFPLSIPSARYCFEKLGENAIRNKEQITAYNNFLYKKDIVPEVKKIQKIIIKK